ncbi:class I SAM-dependent methyltransferase [Pokkaliibacter sp. CJK22405]|uniref:class I SAM-dependent methyltransferase n=1 Tax=Pokkaliibacter sp. CJK22405 TaxID=3384615 RepID=UPI0039856971
MAADTSSDQHNLSGSGADAPHSATMDAASSRTLSHYQSTSEQFWAATRDHDVRQNIDALLSALPTTPGQRILDIGCGPGRDLMAFKAQGHAPVGLDGTPRFVEMAREHSGCEVWHQNLLSLDLPAGRFDGIFANAVLFHIPSSHLPAALQQLFQSLRPGGVLFSSNPRGQNQEGFQGERYGVWHDLEQWRRYLETAGFSYLDHYFRPTGLPFEQQPWLASLWQRPL